MVDTICSSYMTEEISSNLSYTQNVGVVVIVVGNGHGDTSSSPGRD